MERIALYNVLKEVLPESVWRAGEVSLAEKVLVARVVAEIPGLQDNSGGKSLTILKAFGKGGI